MSSEAFVRRFHAQHAGITSRVLARGGSYERLAARVAGAARVLDLGCGNALAPGAIGLDVSREELAAGRGVRVQGRAQALPFATGTFDAAISHLAFMLFDEPPRVVAELDRVLAPGGSFHAVLGGGPTADGRDAFHAFLEHARPRGVPLGDPRARTEAGWLALFAGWRVRWERWAIDLSGPFDDVYGFLASGYQDHADARAALRAELGDILPCTVVMFCASATR